MRPGRPRESLSLRFGAIGRPVGTKRASSLRVRGTAATDRDGSDLNVHNSSVPGSPRRHARNSPRRRTRRRSSDFKRRVTTPRQFLSPAPSCASSTATDDASELENQNHAVTDDVRSDESVVAELKSVLLQEFHLMDQNGDGVIEPSELTFALEQLYGRAVSTDEMHFMMSRLDLNHDNVIEPHEYVKAMFSFLSVDEMRSALHDRREAILQATVFPTRGEPFLLRVEDDASLSTSKSADLEVGSLKRRKGSSSSAVFRHSSDNISGSARRASISRRKTPHRRPRAVSATHSPPTHFRPRKPRSGYISLHQRSKGPTFDVSDDSSEDDDTGRQPSSSSKVIPVGITRRHPMRTQRSRKLLFDIHEREINEIKAELRSSFHRVDLNSNGVVDPAELAVAMRHMCGRDPSDAEVDELFQRLDIAKNGRIAEWEWVQVMFETYDIDIHMAMLQKKKDVEKRAYELNVRKCVEQLERSFHEVDLNADNYIQIDELEVAMTHLEGEKPAAEELNSAMSYFDANHDQKISKEEYVAGMLKTFSVTQLLTDMRATEKQRIESEQRKNDIRTVKFHLRKVFDRVLKEGNRLRMKRQRNKRTYKRPIDAFHPEELTRALHVWTGVRPSFDATKRLYRQIDADQNGLIECSEWTKGMLSMLSLEENLSCVDVLQAEKKKGKMEKATEILNAAFESVSDTEQRADAVEASSGAAEGKLLRGWVQVRSALRRVFPGKSDGFIDRVRGIFEELVGSEGESESDSMSPLSSSGKDSFASTTSSCGSMSGTDDESDERIQMTAMRISKSSFQRAALHSFRMEEIVAATQETVARNEALRIELVRRFHQIDSEWNGSIPSESLSGVLSEVIGRQCRGKDLRRFLRRVNLPNESDGRVSRDEFVEAFLNAFPVDVLCGAFAVMTPN